MPLHFLFEGIDGVGKDTIINELQSILGYRSVIHMSKPKPCAIYNFDLIQYQQSSFIHLMNLLNQKTPLIFNRSHIGEMVYSKYRNSSGEWIYDLENIIEDLNSSVIVLLLARNENLLRDDGESFDYNARMQEQNEFIQACKRSKLNVIEQYVHDEYGNWIDAHVIVSSILEKSKLIDTTTKTTYNINLNEHSRK